MYGLAINVVPLTPIPIAPVVPERRKPFVAHAAFLNIVLLPGPAYTKFHNCVALFAGISRVAPPVHVGAVIARAHPLDALMILYAFLPPGPVYGTTFHTWPDWFVFFAILGFVHLEEGETAFAPSKIQYFF